MPACTCEYKSPWRPEEDMRCSGARVTGSLSHTSMGVGNQTCALQKSSKQFELGNHHSSILS